MSDEETKDKAKTSEAEDDEEPGVTMVDVLEDEESLEADAKAVLGNSDEKHCSYHSGGYMKQFFARISVQGARRVPAGLLAGSATPYPNS